MALNNESSPNNNVLSDNDSIFKKPLVVIGSRSSKNNFKVSKINTNFKLLNRDTADSSPNCDDSVQCETKEEKIEVQCSATKAVNLKYAEPPWSGLPMHKYILEEVKNGQILKRINLSQKPFSLIGRSEDCDITMAHPTVSRYHIVLQHRATADEKETVGFYLYDLGSTHGTFLNKQRVKPSVYIKVKVGHIIKVGCSTRLFVLYGPPEDEEPETEMTWTEMKQKHLEMTLAREQQKVHLEIEKKEMLQEEEEEDGVDWGMGEDADEETDLSENPFATTQNEELYLDDPKKTLSGWFDREGEELEYKVEEKGYGQFVCQVELPVDIGISTKLIAEASVKGKKKEAVVQCALEACRLLDRHGLLRQANKESRKPITKDWEAVDFYDSDEDNFLDRTGDIEKKRRQRMAQSGKLNSTVETYETLVEKYEKCDRELKEAETRLYTMKMSISDNSSDADDEVTNYVKNLMKHTLSDIEVEKLENLIDKLCAEKEHLRKLVNIARPANLPSLTHTTSNKKDDFSLETNSLSTKKKLEIKCDIENLLPEKCEKTVNVKSETVNEGDLSFVDLGRNEHSKDSENKQKRSRTCVQHQKVKKLRSASSEDYSNCTWTPPSGQTGDGRTHLNDQLGY